MVLEEPFNIRAWASEMAPLLLCQFLILNGRFAITPALPVTAAGAINSTSLFLSRRYLLRATSSLDPLRSHICPLRSVHRLKRKALTATEGHTLQVRRSMLPENRTVVVRYSEWPGYNQKTGQLPIEEFPMDQFCSNEIQCLTALKYMLPFVST